jgi:hypothetical protein
MLLLRRPHRGAYPPSAKSKRRAVQMLLGDVDWVK